MGTAEIVVALVVALITSIGALITSLVAISRLRLDRQTAPADMSAKLTMAASEVIDDLREENKRLRDENLEHKRRETENKLEKGQLSLEVNQSRERIWILEDEVENLENENATLREQVKAGGNNH